MTNFFKCNTKSTLCSPLYRYAPIVLMNLVQLGVYQHVTFDFFTRRRHAINIRNRAKLSRIEESIKSIEKMKEFCEELETLKFHLKEIIRNRQQSMHHHDTNDDLQSVVEEFVNLSSELINVYDNNNEQK